MRSFNVKDERTIKSTIVAYPTFSIFLVPVLCIGFAGILYVKPQVLGEPDAILPYMILHMKFPVLVIGLFGAGTLAAASRTARG